MPMLPDTFVCSGCLEVFNTDATRISAELAEMDQDEIYAMCEAKHPTHIMLCDDCANIYIALHGMADTSESLH